MYIKRLSVRNFRNIERECVSFSPEVNLLYGRNAEGKTNLLEAVYYFARGKSFRGATDRELCRFGADGYEIEAAFFGGGRDKTLLYRSFGKEKVRRYNGAPAGGAAEMIGHLRAVLFHPEHLSLVKGSPAERREFLNIAISQNEPSYLPLYASYIRILENRNSLLKMAAKGLPIDFEELAVFGDRLAFAAARVAAYRFRYMNAISPLAARLLSEISSGREELSLSYHSEVREGDEGEMEQAYKELFSSDIRREISAGFTVFGPHHDDMRIEIGGYPAREYASQGQQRSITLALKLGEGEVSREQTGEYPIFLFDDVMSELDAERRQFLLSSLRGRQIIVTACDERDFDRSSVNLIKTSGGHYEAVSQ